MSAIPSPVRSVLISLAALLAVSAWTGAAEAQSNRSAARAAAQVLKESRERATDNATAKLVEQAVKAAEEAAREAEAAAAAAKRAAASAKAAAELFRRARGSGGSAAPPEGSQSSAPRATPRAGGNVWESRSSGRVLRVGPKRAIKLPSQAARTARDGDTIEIDAGLYAGDVAVWRADDLTIRGVGGRPHIDSRGRTAERKAVWVITGDNATVENIEISGAQVRDRNGSGIRFEGRGLTLRRAYLHHNEMGILTRGDPASDVVIEESEFAYNTVDYKRFHSLGHNIYIGPVRSFTLRGSYVHNAATGHNVKTRARLNHIEYNRLADGVDGSSSYVVEIAEGGNAYLVGNIIQQGRLSENWSAIKYFAGEDGPDARIRLLHNTIVSDRPEGVFVDNLSRNPAVLVNNLLVGHAQPVSGPARMVSNLILDEPPRRQAVAETKTPKPGSPPTAATVLRDREGFDYRLRAGAAAIDTGADPRTAWDGAAPPDRQYAEPLGTNARPDDGRPDIGAYEFKAR